MILLNFSCPSGFTDHYCRYQWHSWILILIGCAILSAIALIFLRYHSKLIQLKYLFSYHRLREQIGFETNSTNTIYSHVPTSDTNNHHDDNEISALEMTDTQINNSKDEFQDDPFYIDEKQPIFSNDRN